MSVVSRDLDVDRLTLTLVAELPASEDEAWRLWADPRLLERWWGTPGRPATVEAHDLVPGGEVTYYMTDRAGERFHGWWRVTQVSAPHSLELVDGFADQDGVPIREMPLASMRVLLSGTGPVTHLELRTAFASRGEMDQLLAMGLDVGLEESLGQMDAVLGSLP